ncbi:MAG: hypothetical protein Q4D37_00425 [Oscillospiraceae bacterium]|nr:hypothetical protein [Oscillospiraceae bacterium]
MIAEVQRQQAITVIKAVLHAIQEKNYTTISKLVDHSDLPMDELEEVIEETLRLNRQKNIPPFTEANAAFFEDEDGAGFEVEYLLTKEMVLIFEFFLLEGKLHSVLEEIAAN